MGTMYRNFGHIEMGQAAGQRAGRRAREASIEVAAVRQISCVGQIAVNIDDWDGDQRPPQSPDQRMAKQAANDLNAVDLVAMDCSTHDQGGARAFSVHNLGRQRAWRMVR